MATTTTAPSETSTGCQVWATISCTDTPDTAVTLPSGVAVVACLPCAEHAADLALALVPSAGRPPF